MSRVLVYLRDGLVHLECDDPGVEFIQIDADIESYEEEQLSRLDGDTVAISQEYPSWTDNAERIWRSSVS